MPRLKPNYPKLYSIKPTNKIIFYFVSLVFLIVGIKFLTLSGPGIVIGLIFIALGPTVFISTQGMKVILWADSIEIKIAFSHKIIQKNEIWYYKKYRKDSSYVIYFYLKDTSKRSICLPSGLYYDDDFFAWLDDIPDADNLFKKKSNQEIIIHLLACSSLLLLIADFFPETLQHLTVFSLFLTQVVGLHLALKHPDLYTLRFTRPNETEVSLSFLFLIFFTCMFCFLGISHYKAIEFLDWIQVIKPAIFFSIVLVYGYALVTFSNKVDYLTKLLLAVIFIPYFIALLLYINVDFSKSEPQYFKVPVLSTSQYKARGKIYHQITVADWRGQGVQRVLGVKADENFDPGVCIKEYSGVLGYAWFKWEEVSYDNLFCHTWSDGKPNSSEALENKKSRTPAISSPASLESSHPVLGTSEKNQLSPPLNKIDMNLPPSLAKPPIIDGMLSLGEWDSADHLDFDVRMPDETDSKKVTRGTVYLRNAGGNIYFGVKIIRPIMGKSSASFSFDNNNEGTVYENGDDTLLINPDFPDSDDYDGVRTNEPPCEPGKPEGFCGSNDIAVGGTKDGKGAATNNGVFSFYEFSHPLKSPDSKHDFSLEPGGTIGYILKIRFCDNRCIDTSIPDERYFNKIMLTPAGRAVFVQ